MKVGIGITTRNRSDILDICLDHFRYFENKNYPYSKIVVVDDNSDLYEKNNNIEICEKYSADYYYNFDRKGIAKTKNVCISRLKDCDYIFLLDDDCFPKQHGWDNYYINIYEETGIEHMLWMQPEVQEHLQLIETVGNINKFSNCMGVLMFFTKNAIEQLGGFDPRFNIYGFEHAQLSKRANDAGLMNNIGPYVAPKDCSNYIYSMDMNYQWLYEPIPLVKLLNKKYSFIWKSSISYSDREKYIQDNSEIWISNYDIKVEI
ncbi:MAG: glycosyltransferase [Tenuifilaceae bacterium]|jgi:hypothetical protein|nr:glycosyltransferase [Tenuifilaceae bacterium]